MSVHVVVFLVLLALAFDFMNGFHDAATSIATIVSTRVLRPQWAVLWAAFFNFLALAIFGVAVAATVGKGIVDPGIVDHHVIFGALVVAIAWNIITWYYGIPSSSSHALIGGLAGAAVAKGGVDTLIASGFLKTAAAIVRDGREVLSNVISSQIDLHAKFGAEMPTWQSTMHLYPIDGAAHDVDAADTAWAYRDANWGSVFAGVDNDPANAEKISRWCVEYFEALHPYSAGGAYVNMMMDEGQERVRASYGPNYDRLAQVKASYDPSNLFRLNQNVPPSNIHHVATPVRAAAHAER